MSSNWLSYYSDPSRNRRVLPPLYNGLAQTIMTFQEHKVESSLEKLFATPATPVALISFDGDKFGVHVAHHFTFAPKDQSNPRNASTLFAFLGHKASAPVTLIDVKTLELVTNKATPVYTPLGEALFDLKNLERPVLEELLKLDTNVLSPLVLSACFPIPPLAIEAIAKHGPYDIEGILSAFMSTLCTWPAQYASVVSTVDVYHNAFPFAQFLWWALKMTSNPDWSPADEAILKSLPGLPTILEVDSIPAETLEDLAEHAKFAGIPFIHATKKTTQRVLSVDSDNSDSDDEQLKKLKNFDFKKPEAMNELVGNLLVTMHTLTKTTLKKDKQAALQAKRHADDLDKRHEERKRNDEAQCLLIEKTCKTGESSSSGFSKLLGDNQRMLLRLATPISGVTPEEPSTFQTTFFATKKDIAHSLLKQACERYNAEFVVGKGVSLRTLSTDIPASNRDSTMNISLLNFTGALVVVHSTDDLCDRQALANNQVEGSTMKKIAGDIVWEFPSDGNALVRGLFKYAVYFDVLAGLSPTSGTSTLIAQKIRSLASTLANRIDKMQTLQNQDPDAIAQFANTIDTKINIFLNHCFKDAIFDPTRLDELETLDKYLDCGFSSILCTIPSFLLERLPSHRFAKRGAGQPPGGASPPVIKQAKTGDEGGAGARQFQARINPNKLDIPAGHTYQSLCPPGSFRRSPRIKIGNKAGRPCLNYYLRGECRYRICQNMHGPLRPQDKVKLEAFIAAQAANPNGDANPPAAADEDES